VFPTLSVLIGGLLLGCPILVNPFRPVGIDALGQLGSCDSAGRKGWLKQGQFAGKEGGMTPLERRRRDFFLWLQGDCLNDDDVEVISILSDTNGSRRWRSSGVMPPSQPAIYWWAQNGSLPDSPRGVRFRFIVAIITVSYDDYQN